MWNTFKTNVVLPLAVRIGSLGTGYLVGFGINAEHADWVGMGIAGALLISVDLMLSWVRRWSIVAKTIDTVLYGQTK